VHERRVRGERRRGREVNVAWLLSEVGGHIVREAAPAQSRSASQVASASVRERTHSAPNSHERPAATRQQRTTSSWIFCQRRPLFAPFSRFLPREVRRPRPRVHRLLPCSPRPRLRWAQVR
jgi:hypothetical protein